MDSFPPTRVLLPKLASEPQGSRQHGLETNGFIHSSHFTARMELKREERLVPSHTTGQKKHLQPGTQWEEKRLVILLL